LTLPALGLWLRLRPSGVEGLIGELRLRHGDRLELEPARFADLPGWRQDRLAAALPAFLRSCGRLTALPDDAPLGGAGFAGKVADWRRLQREEITRRRRPDLWARRQVAKVNDEK